MTKLNVIEIPNPILYQKAEEVKEVTPEIKTLLSDMLIYEVLCEFSELHCLLIFHSCL